MTNSEEGKKSRRDNIKVVVRSRPLNAKEREAKTPSLVSCDTESNKVHVAVHHGSKRGKKDYNFDMVFGQYATQQEIYNRAISPIVDEVLQGFNCTVFAYGQTGTGKTYTMEGDISSEDKKGIIPRAVDTIFQRLEARAESEFSVKVSFLEIYNEDLSDLLSPTDDQKLRILDDKSKINKGVCCHNLEEIAVKNTEDLVTIMQKAMAKRRTAATKLNEHSSRSHCIFTLTLHSKETTAEGEDLLKVGKLNLVDLAGSECVGRSGAKDKRAREAGNINQSLLTLGRVITALVERTPHVPYRDSKLTRLLQESLGGRTKTCIIATVAPSVQCLDETLSTLEYAQRAKRIKNKPVVNQRMTKRVLIREYVDEIERLKSELACARTKDGVFLPEEKYNEMMASMTGQTTQLTELEATLEQRMKELEELKMVFETTTQELESTKEDLKDTRINLEETKEELVVTEKHLEEEKVKVEETNVLLDAHVKTEEKLSSHAKELHGLLDTTISDVKGLHSKIGRKVVVETHNLTAGEKYHAAASSSMGKLKANTASFASSQLSSFSALATRVSAAADQSGAFTELMLQSLQKLAKHAEDTGAETRECVKKLSSAQRSSWQTLDMLTEKNAADFCENTGAAVSKLQEGISLIAKSVQAHQEQMNAFSGLILSQTKAAHATLSDFVSTHAKGVAEVESGLDNALGAYMTKMEASSDNLRSMVDEENARAEKKMQDLAAMFTSALAEANKERFDRVGALFSRSQEHQKSLAGDFEVATTSAKGSISTLQADSSKYFEDAKSSWSGIQSLHASESEKLSATVESMASQAENLGSEIVAQVGTLEARHKEYIECYTARSVAANTKLGEDGEAFADMRSQAESDGAALSNECTSALNARREAFGSWCHETSSASEHQKNALDAFASAHTSDIDAHASECDSFFNNTLSVDVPTGMTPAKRDYPHKHHTGGCPMTSPHDIILQRYRSRMPNTEVASESPESCEEDCACTSVSFPEKSDAVDENNHPGYGEHSDFSAKISGHVADSKSPPAAPETVLGESTKGNVRSSSIPMLKRSESVGSRASRSSFESTGTEESCGDESENYSVLPSKLSHNVLKKMKVNRLREELGKRGLSKVGRKDALITRLLEGAN